MFGPCSAPKSALLVQARSMQDNIGDCTEAGPSRAVQMIGLNNVPVAGDEFIVLPSIDEVSCLCCAAYSWGSWMALTVCACTTPSCGCSTLSK